MTNSVTNLSIGGSDILISGTLKVFRPGESTVSPLPEGTAPTAPAPAPAPTPAPTAPTAPTGSEVNSAYDEELTGFEFDQYLLEDYSDDDPLSAEPVLTPRVVTNPYISQNAPTIRAPASAPSDSYSKPFIWKK